MSKRKIQVFITLEENGLFDKIKGFFLKQEIKKALNSLRDLPLEQVKELLITTFTQKGYQAIKDEKGTTLIRQLPMADSREESK